MKDNDQRIALSKWAGWDTTRQILGSVYVYHDPNGNIAGSLPDYLNSLDAVHGLEKKLDRAQLWEVTHHLSNIVNSDIPIAHATSRQRCEAILRTLSLWKEAEIIDHV